MTHNLILAEIPKKIYQDDFSPGRGNALQAVVASVFGLSLSTVPNFVAMPGGYEAAIRQFCELGGIRTVKVGLANGMAPRAEDYDKRICILRGKSPRGDFGHVVVARLNSPAFEFLHDPHPDGTFLDTENESFGWCMFFLEE